MSCEHEKTKERRFLTSHLTPHMYEPDTKSVMCCVFLCEACGDLFTASIEVLRSYMPDGALPPEIAKISEQKVKNHQMDLLVEARAGQLAAQRLKLEAEAKKPGASRHPDHTLLDAGT